MASAAQPDPVQVAVTTDLPPRQAYELFTAGMSSWWPREYTWSQDSLKQILIEPGRDRFCVERGPHDITLHWGRVLVWDPYDRLEFTWQIGPDRVPVPDEAYASEVEVRFASPDGDPEKGPTEVSLEHRHFGRHRGDPAAYRDAMASSRGWPHILGRFAA